MRFITPLLSLLLCAVFNMSAEGTRELAPNANIMIGAASTTDLAALHINHPAYNNFASYTNNDSHSRLYIHIADPSKECVFLGFSFGHLNVTSPNPTRTNFEYRVKDPAGNIVFGPVTILTTGGNIQNWSQGFTGPAQINGAGGYNAHEITSTDLASQGWTGAGDYYVEFLSAGDGDLLIDFWDITVADCTPGIPVAKKGRVWSYNWSIFAVNDFNFPNRPFNGAFYVCAPDPDDTDKAFITKIDFNGSGFRPAAFNIAFNSFGSQNTGNIEEDRKSVQMFNSTQSEYAIFLNDPVELCETAVVGEIILHGISRCDAGDYCLKFTASKEGQVDLLLDLDGPDDIFTAGTRDVLITHTVSADEAGVATCISWNGLDGLGIPLPEVPGTQIPVTIAYAQGIYHFPIYDAELMTSGFNLQAVRPAASIPLLYYDDSNIDVASGSGEPSVQLSGCTVPCHRWTTFVNNNVTGFGNLNTINSWWFSQRIVRQDILLLPGYYTCAIDGPQSICQGSTTQIILQPQLHPATVESPQIINTTWTGPGIIGVDTGNVITIGAQGDYHVNVTWLTGLGDTCSTSCDYALAINPPLAQTIDTLIVQGEILNINDELYTEAGQYVQNLTNSFGCDSILTINVLVLQTVVYYDLDACWSFMSDGSHMDYSEFTATQPEPLSCATITAGIVFREPVQMQKHSCTPGVDNSVAMCISSLDFCNYDAGNDASLVFEMTISPDPDTSVRLTGLSFFEKAPVTYNWISGDSGPNNYPTLYGLRILKNGVEIYRREDIPTTNGWTLQSYDFSGDDFLLEEPATYRFELLPYCLIGNGAAVAAWDIDEISVTASCAPFEGLTQIISGKVTTPSGDPVKDVVIHLTERRDDIQYRSLLTDHSGAYVFENVTEQSECTIRGWSNGDYLNGVSTMDLVFIQRHLLGRKPFDSPYQFIAADANHSNTISAKDLLDLRKLILGTYTELPNNTSWRFGTANENQNGGFPWGFRETIDIENLQYDFHNANFTAVKIGDVNGDADLNFSDQEISSRNDNALYLYVNEQPLLEHQPVKIDIKAGTNAILTGMQLGLQLNGLTIQHIEGGKLLLDTDHFNVNEEGLKLSWHTNPVMDIKPGDVLFSMIVIPQRDGSLSSMVNIDDEILLSEAYLGDELQRVAIDLGVEGSETFSRPTLLFQNEPNPFSDHTNVRFQLEQPGEVTITIINLSGQVIREISEYHGRGLHSIELRNLNEDSGKGILFCQMQTNGYIETIRMVILD